MRVKIMIEFFISFSFDVFVIMNFKTYPVIFISHGRLFPNYCLNVETYKLSTLSLAHCVLRKNLSDDFIEGSLLKQLMSILFANSSQP